MMNLGHHPISGFTLAALHFFVAGLRQDGSDQNCLGYSNARPRYRACLQDGLKLDLNHLARGGFIKFGANIGARDRMEQPPTANYSFTPI